jgi:hypothetical protein
MLDFACRNDSVLSFYQSNEAIVTFHRDGRVEINPKYSAEEAAKAFWNAVIRMNPFQQEPERMLPLVDDAKDA